MELSNEFTVNVPVDQAWRVLTDLERIAPCLPGAELQEIEGDEHRGVVKIKVGPITAQYKGVARFTERDDAAHRAVLRAEGRDTRGAGNASATVTASLVPAGDGATKVLVETDLTVTGKVAQFGRGVLADVSAKMMDQFAASLDAELRNSTDGAADVPAEAAPVAAPAEVSGPRKIESRPAEPVAVAGPVVASVAKRSASAVIGTAVVVLWLMRRRRKKRK